MIFIKETNKLFQQTHPGNSFHHEHALLLDTLWFVLIIRRNFFPSRFPRRL